MGLGCDIDVDAPPLRRRNVRYGSLADITNTPDGLVRFVPEADVITN